MQNTPAALAAAPQPGHYDIDPGRSRVTFATRHWFGLGPVSGSFAVRGGVADVADPVESSAVYAEIETASFRTRSRARDRAVLSPRFLDAAGHPVMTFRSERIEAGGQVAAAATRGSPNAITVTGLRKSYGSVQAVRDVSFAVRTGEIVALLGPNGAGKTTTLEILEGFRARDGGAVDVLGRDPGDRAAIRELRELTGLVLQDIAVEPYLTVRETIARQAGYYRAARPVPEVIALAGLGGLERRKVRSLSGGQKRRLDLALGLVGSPELLYLDEPTTGFDPAARRGAWDLVRSLRAAGTTILLTTHDMAEAQALADRVVLLAGGAVIAEGPPAALGGRDADRARISFTLPPGIPAAALPVPAGVHDGVVVIETADVTGELGRLTVWAARRGVALSGLTVDRPSLEDVYLRLTRQSARSGAPERNTR